MERQAELTVVYSDAMVAPAQGGSPSAAKPAAVVADWRARGFPLRVLPAEPVTVAQLALAHGRGYVEDVLARRRPNGFGTRCERVAASLPYTTGAMLTAAREALATRGAVCAPASGFHHAAYEGAWGFCTFNGLAVTALALRAEGRVARVAIVDCDQHEGDGTADILARVGAEGSVRHSTAGADFRHPSQVPDFFAWLEEEAAAFEDVDLVLYQAGADPHVDDPLGGWMTSAQMRERDARVFEAAARARVPLVWNLAGGYQLDAQGGIEPVLAIHRATAEEHLRVFCARDGGGALRAT